MNLTMAMQKSLITSNTTKNMTAETVYHRMKPMFNPPSVGKILREDYMDPLNLSISELARRMCVHRHTVMRVVNDETRISLDFARRLAKVLGTSVGVWLRLQQARDEWEATQMDETDLQGIQPILWQPPEQYSGV